MTRRHGVWRRPVISLLVLTVLSFTALLGAGEARAVINGSTLSIYGGDGTSTAITPGPATSSSVYHPSNVTTDDAGNAYMVFNRGGTNRYSVVKIDTGGTISYVMNTALASGAATPGPAVSSRAGLLNDIASDGAGNLYVVDADRYRVYKIDTAGQLSIFAGTGTRPSGALIPGPATSTDINPTAVAVGPDGSVYIGDYWVSQVARIDPSGQLTVVAGNGTSGPPTTGGPATSSALGYNFGGLAADSTGNLFISDRNSRCVVMVEAGTGTLNSVAGTCGTSGSITPGPAASSLLRTPQDIAVDRYDDLYLVDSGNAYIVKVTAPASGSGALSIFAGNGASGTVTPGPALSTTVDDVTGVAVDRSLNVYLAEGLGDYIDRISGAPSAPGAPTGLTGTAGVSVLNLSFTAPSDDGGTAITSYESSIDGGSSWQPLTTTGSVTITGQLSGLPNGTPVTVAVRARNTVGPGTASGTVTGTPTAPAPRPAPPSPGMLTSTGPGGAPQHVTVHLMSGQMLALLDGGRSVASLTVPGVGRFSAGPASGVISFVPVPGYSGTPSGVTYQVSDPATGTGASTYVPTVTLPDPPSPSALTTHGPEAQRATVSLAAGETVSLLDIAGQPAGTVSVAGQGRYALAGSVITFTPVRGFHGVAQGVRFRVTDAYEQVAEATYTATVTVAAPAPKPLPRIDRSHLVKIPANPQAVHGAKRRTKAFNASHAGIDAYPIPALGTRLLRKGQATTLSGDGLFDFDSARLTARGRAEVKLVVRNLRSAHAVRCEGYTDYAGSRGHEMTLSRQRAQAVCAALKAYGAKVATSSTGYGPQRPVVVGGTAQSRKENRRVVIVVAR